MAIEFTCLSCTRTFSVPIADLLKMDYLSCIGCGRPVPADLLSALRRVGQSMSLSPDAPNNQSMWHVRIKHHPQSGTTRRKPGEAD